MLLLLLGGVLLGAPDVLVVLAPPDAPGVLRDRVWPALQTERVGRWRLRPTDHTRLDEPVKGAAGALWADRAEDGRIRLHRVLFDPGVHLVDAMALPPDAPAAAMTDAVRLRLRFLLDAPAEQGERWQPDRAPPPLPPPFVLPAEHRVDLELVRAPPIPKRQVRIPTPPPPLSVEPTTTTDVQPPDASERPTWVGLGFDGLADLTGVDGGLLARVEVPVGARYHVAIHGALHPFHDFVRGERPVGVTGYRAAAAWGWALRPGAAMRWDIRAGLGIQGLSATGADTGDSGLEPVLVVEAPLRFELRSPFALGVEAGLVAAPAETRAWHASGTLVRRSVIQARLGLLLEWGIP